MIQTEEEAFDGYGQYRGKCYELSKEACEKDSSLTLVRGHYYCPVWNTVEPHWWTVRQDGSIFDPTSRQFPSNGSGFYEEFDGMISCSECGKKIKEEEADIQGNYAFCSGPCYGRFVGVF